MSFTQGEKVVLSSGRNATFQAALNGIAWVVDEDDRDILTEIDKLSPGIPDVKFKDSWKLEDGCMVEYYDAGGWTFERIVGDGHFEDDANVVFAKKAIASWTAWKLWLEENIEN
jgi:hypothetical protein